MGLLHIYDTVSNEHKSIKANGKLRDILPGYDFSKCAVIKEGERLTADYTVTENDIIFIRAVPGMTGLAIAAVVVAVVAVGVAVGTTIYANKMAAEAEEKAKKAQENAKKLAQQVTQYPFIKGANNESALGKSIQFVMGSVYNTPYKINDGFYSIGGENGEKQYYNVMLSAGFGKQLIQSLSIGNEKIKTFDDTEPQQGIYDFDEGSLYYDSENKIEITQNRSFQTAYFNRKVISNYSGEEIKHEHGQDAEALIIQCAEHTMTVEVCVQFNGLRKFSDNNWKQKSVTIKLEWSNDGDTTWNSFTFDRGSNTFTFNSNHTLRFTATKSFTYAQAYGKQISIRLTRETPKEESSSQESAYCLYVNSFCYDNQKSKSSLVPCQPLESPFNESVTKIGVRIIANQNTQGMIEKINAMCYGVARTWNKVLRVWSEEKTTTRNPASWILEIMQSDTHAVSKISDEEIDPFSFGALYEYCEDEGFYCDGIIIKGEKKETLISKILTLCNADLYIDSDGKYAVAIDKKESTPVALLNAQSVRSINVAKSFARNPDGIKATFTNRDTWQTDTRYVMRDGGEKGLDDVCTETAIEYATDAEHIYKICQRRMRQQILQPREIKAKVGREGDYYPLYSTVLLQLEQLRQGIRSTVIHEIRRDTSGRIVSFVVGDLLDYGDTMQEPYTDENGETYTDEILEPYSDIKIAEESKFGIIIQAQNGNGKRHIARAVYGFGKSRNVYLLRPIEDDGGILPCEGNILSFGLLGEEYDFKKITNEMKITGVAPDGDGWELTLRDYSEEIYEYGVIPEYKSNLTTLSDLASLHTETLQEINGKAETDSEKADIIGKIASGDSETKQQAKDYTDEKSEEAAVAGTTELVLSHSSIQFHLYDAGNSLYAETKTFTAALMQGNSGVTADSVSATTTTGTSSFSVSASKNGSVITVTVTSVYGRTFSPCDIKVTAVKDGHYYTATCSLTAEDTGLYSGGVSSLSALPASPELGSCITWTENNTSSALVYGGTFKKTYVYRYVGTTSGAYKWIAETRPERNADALNDILALNTEDSAQFNSYALTFLNRLVANDIFVDNITTKLLQAKTGFITNLLTKTLELKSGGVIKSQGYTWDSQQKGFMIKADGSVQIQDGDFKGKISAKVFHFDTTVFSVNSTSWTDSAGNNHAFENGDMWFIGS